MKYERLVKYTLENQLELMDGHKDTVLFQAVEELIEYKEIEEELGIDLITLSQAFRNGFYWILDNGKNTIDHPTNKYKTMALRQDEVKGWFLHFGWYDLGVPLRAYLKDYGKNSGGGWVLSRREWR